MKTRATTAEPVHGPGPEARHEREASLDRPTDSLSALARAAAGRSEMTPEQLHRLHGFIGNRAVSSLLRAGRLRAVQAKLKVGPADDPYEREADRVASEVLRAPVPAQATEVQRRAASITPLVQRHAGHGAHEHEHEHEEDDHEPTLIQQKRLGAADGGFQAQGDLTARVAEMSTRGAELTEPLRGEMEARFGADFSGVRIHTDAEAARLSRDMGADAFTHGRHIAFAAGRYDPHSSAGKWLLAHELTHTIQQTGADKRPRERDPLVQRHSTHEHYLLGTLQPDELASLPSIREEVAKAKDSKGKKKEDELLDDPRKDVLHLLEEEMTRLLKWQKKTPETQLKEQDKEYGKKIGKAPKLTEEEKLEKGKSHDYEVSYVRIPTKDNTSVICTYGELNTLADMFGTIEDMSNTEPEVIVKMLQGVRQRVYIELYKIYTEIWTAIDKNKLKSKVKKFMPSTSFEGAVGFTGKEKGGIGAAFAVKGYEAVTLSEEDEFTASNATAALARNACHFAPETWHTWKRYHDKARALAGRAYKRGQDAKFVQQNVFNAPEEEVKKGAEAAEKEQQEAANLALLYSGFGDHYLQDAYASGHLIDKTKVMQWFFAWQKKQGVLKDTPGYAMIGAIVEQELKSNPQMMENVKGGVSQKLETIGVELKEHILLLMWWRRRAHNNPKKYKKMTALEILQTEPAPPLSEKNGNSAVKALNALVGLGFVTVTKGKQKGVDVYEISQDQIDVLDKDQEKGPYKSQPSGDNLESYKAQAKEFYYVAYAKFLDKAHLQLITNFLHNTFCEQGLTVETKAGEHIGKIYGDTKMLSAGGQDGVFHSATTAQMAREAIYEILETGNAKHSTADIDARFPRQVAPDWKGVENTKPIAIDQWWAKLEEECTKEEGFFEQGTKRLNIKGLLTKRMVKRLTEDEKIVTPVDELQGNVAPQKKKKDELINIFDELLEEPSLAELAKPSHDPVY